MDLKFGVWMFKETRETLESFKVRNNTFLLQPFERRKKMTKFSLYMETKVSIKLNIFDT